MVAAKMHSTTARQFLLLNLRMFSMELKSLIYELEVLICRKVNALKHLAYQHRVYFLELACLVASSDIADLLKRIRPPFSTSRMKVSPSSSPI